MTVGSIQRTHAEGRKSSVKLEDRLEDLEGQKFFQLTCDDHFTSVSNGFAEWNQKDLTAALRRGPALASDPARGNKITEGGIEEAAVALTAEAHEIFETVTRESSGGAEFIDNQGVAWDVKSPLSPPPGQNWEYSPDHQISRIRKDLSQGDKVLFNLSRVNDKDRDDTLRLLQQELTCDERSQLLILTDPEVASQ
jgi:hypothetical protein